jgi:hypothetical protein
MAKSIFAPQHKHYRLFDIPSLDIHLGSPHYGHVSKRPMKLLHITTKEKGVWKIFHNSLRLALQSSHSLHILFDRAVKQRRYSRLGCNFGFLDTWSSQGMKVLHAIRIKNIKQPTMFLMKKKTTRKLIYNQRHPKFLQQVTYQAPRIENYFLPQRCTQSLCCSSYYL